MNINREVEKSLSFDSCELASEYEPFIRGRGGLGLHINREVEKSLSFDSCELASEYEPFVGGRVGWGWKYVLTGKWESIFPL